MKRSTSVKDRIQTRLSKLRKQPVVTPEQKLQCKLESLTKEAEELQKECATLQTKANSFAERAPNSQRPTSPPPNRKPLFKSDQPGSRYDAQVAASKLFSKEWQAYEKEVHAFGMKIERFEAKLGRMKKEHLDPQAPMGNVEHQFEGLDNALGNLKKERVELSKAVAGVPAIGKGKTEK